MRISVIIPSRERGRYLQESLKTCTAIDDPDLEILVSDNASTDNTRQVVEAAPDPRVRYVNTGQRMSVRQNFEFSLGHSTGDYVVMFGDDDGILPGQFPMLRALLEQHRPDGISWPRMTYGWPVEGMKGKPGGLRFKRGNCFGAPIAVDPAANLAKACAGQMDDPREFPELYHGCMSRAFLDRCRHKDGTYFLGTSPDVYMIFRAMLARGQIMSVSHPFSLNGLSPSSTGGSYSSLGKDKAKKRDLRFVDEVKLDPVEDVFPLSASMALIYLSTFQTALHHFPDASTQIDYRAWYIRSLVDRAKKNPEFAARIDRDLEAHAAQFGATEALAEARAARAVTSTRLSRLRDKIDLYRGSFRRSAEMDGSNTVWTAAQVADTILGDDFAHVLSGVTTSAQAWRNAKQRAGAFAKRL